MRIHGFGFGLVLVAMACSPVRGAERVTLKNGFELDCVRREPVGEPTGEKVRLYFAVASDSGSGDSAVNYMDVAADAVVRIETVPDAPVAVKPAARSAAMGTAGPTGEAAASTSQPTREEMHEMLAHAGAAHHIDEDLLASVVRAESGGHRLAVSRTGAQGLMQLMPGTARNLGVADAFEPEQNIAGGTAYLDALLTRYHDNAALALAAYNAGPGAVDRYHGVPPYRETRAYVARVIREFNLRKQMALVALAK